jgi:hypothetical protein
MANNKSKKAPKVRTKSVPKQIKSKSQSPVNSLKNRLSQNVLETVNASLQFSRKTKQVAGQKLITDDGITHNSARFKKIGDGSFLVSAKDCCTPAQFTTGSGPGLALKHPTYIPTVPQSNLLIVSSKGVLYSYDRDLYTFKNIYAEDIIITANTPVASFTNPDSVVNRKQGFRSKGGLIYDRITLKPGQTRQFSMKMIHYNMDECPMVYTKPTEELTETGLERVGINFVVMIPTVSDLANAAIADDANICEVQHSMSGRFTEVEPTVAPGVVVKQRADENSRVFNIKASDLNQLDFVSAPAIDPIPDTYGSVSWGMHFEQHYLHRVGGVLPANMEIGALLRNEGSFMSILKQNDKLVLMVSKDGNLFEAASLTALQDFANLRINIPSLGIVADEGSTIDYCYSVSNFAYDGVVWCIYNKNAPWKTTRPVSGQAGVISTRNCLIVQGVTVAERIEITRRLTFLGNPLTRGLPVPPKVVVARDWLATLQNIVQTVTTVAQVVVPLVSSFV